MNPNLIVEWLHRVLEEKTQDSKKIQERISVLNHQIQYFKGMHERYQKEVLQDLIKDIEFYHKNSKINWETALEQIKRCLQDVSD